MASRTVSLRWQSISSLDDLSIYFTKADVLALGDVWWNGIHPFIDKSHGESIDGTIRATNEGIAKVTG